MSLLVYYRWALRRLFYSHQHFLKAKLRPRSLFDDPIAITSGERIYFGALAMQSFFTSAAVCIACLRAVP
jgi:hypothetical protein